jgi:predicted nucleic acid-binding Zn ribbon protein
MNQALYAHVNNKRKRKKNKKILFNNIIKLMALLSR